MKKNIAVTALLLLCTILTYAQIPNGYYNNASGKTGNALKAALHDIIKGHTEYPYTSSSTDVWDILKQTDKDPNNSSNVILLYSGWSVNAAQEYNGGSGWSREHVWAKSRGSFGTSAGAGTDVHHLRPADVSVNSARSNRWFDESTVPYVDGDGATGSFTSNSKWTWEPRPQVKGDVARMIFYMAVRYEGTNGEPDLEVVDYLPSNKFTTSPIHAKLSALLQWHKDDPVDAFEQNRNNVIYGYQNNRNPFIDHPEYVCEIWGGNCAGSGGGGGNGGGGNGGGGNASTHVETFDNLSAGSSYSNGSFTGVDNVTWTYKSTKGNVTIDGKAATLGKNRSPKAEIVSGTLANGVGTLKFDYKQAYSTTVDFEIYVNNTLVGEVYTSSQGVKATTNTFNVNVSGNAVIKIVQTDNGSGQVAIDNITWTDHGTSSGGGSGGGSASTYTETFDNNNAGTSTYTSGSFTGVNNITWNYVASRNQLSYGINGNGLMLRRSSSNSKVYGNSIAGGIAEVEFDLKKAFTGSGNRSVAVYVNGNHIGTTTGFDDTQVHHFKFDNINVSGSFNLEIRNATSKQVVIDNLSWKTYTAKMATNVTEIQSAKTFNVYPSPTEGVLNINASFDADQTSVKVYNINGQEVISQNISFNGNVTTIDLSQLPKGIYIVKIANKEISTVKRIQKM